MKRASRNGAGDNVRAYSQNQKRNPTQPKKKKPKPPQKKPPAKGSLFHKLATKEARLMRGLLSKIDERPRRKKGKSQIGSPST